MKKYDRYLIPFLILLILLTSCGKKNDPYIPHLPSGATDRLEELIDEKEEQGNTDVPEIEVLHFSPCEGFSISVPKDHLYEDTEFKVEPVTEDTPHIREIIEDRKSVV